MLSKEEKDRRILERKEARIKAKELARIETEKNQKPVRELTITIEWKKSAMWGMNPYAMAVVYFQDGTSKRKDGYKASGWGYDKESTIIAGVFNDFLKYRLWSDDLQKDNDYWLNGEKVNKPYGISMGNTYRYYDGGIGTDCYYKIAEFIGGKFNSIASGKTFNVYNFKMN